MKKIFALLALLAFLSGCDDGDMAFKTFNFSNAQPQRCSNSNLIFKVQDTEVLILNLDPAALLNAETPDDEPRIITVSGTGANSIIYRNYSSTVSGTAVLCSGIPPATPTVNEEWIGEGTLQIITDPVLTEGVLTGYTHQIILISIRFSKSDEEITINNNLFGSVSTTLGYTFSFGTEEEPGTVYECNGMIFKRSTDEALQLLVENGTFTNTPGVVNLELGGIGNLNRLIFDVYNGTITNNTLCDAIAPVTPVIEQRWNATSGIVEITTTESNVTPGTYVHTIRFIDVIFTNADNTGAMFTVLPNGEGNYYYFGTYTL